MNKDTANGFAASAFGGALIGVGFYGLKVGLELIHSGINDYVEAKARTAA